MEIKIDKEKLEEAKMKAKEALQKGKEAVGKCYTWVRDNKEDLMGLIPLVFGGIGVAKALKPTFGERERDRKDNEYYDPCTGMRWRLKRKPTNSEWAELARRKRCGEAVEDILDDMRILK